MSHDSKIKDTETHFVIDPLTRKITNTSSGNNTIVQHDHNSERFTFEIPRYVDGHDMLESTTVRIHYRNGGSTNLMKTNGVYSPDDLSVSAEDENTLTFSWLISSASTQCVGYLYFSVQFLCCESDNVLYAWSTGIYKDISVIESLNHTDEVLPNDVDAIAAIKNEVMAEIETVLLNASKSVISEVTLRPDQWVGENSPYSQRVEIEGVTENSKVDLTPSAEQLAIFHEKDLAFVTENEDGVVTVYAIGQKPTNDYTIQVTMTEVKV
jgi:hypothetical protein